MSKSGALSGTIPGGRGGIRLTPSGVQETEEVYSLQVGEPLFSLVTGVEASDGRISAKPCLGKGRGGVKTKATIVAARRNASDNN